MKLRPASPEDAAALAAVHVQCWRETYSNIVSAEFLAALSVSKREEGWRRHLENPGQRFDFVADFDGAIGGYCSGGPLRSDWGNNAAFSLTFPEHLKVEYDGELFAAYLLRSRQRQGAGRAMFEKISAELKSRGFAAMLVWVLNENPACGFYEKMGGVLAGESRIMIDREHGERAYGWKL